MLIIILSTCWPPDMSSCCACVATCPERPPGSLPRRTLAFPVVKQCNDDNDDVHDGNDDVYDDNDDIHDDNDDVYDDSTQ